MMYDVILADPPWPYDDKNANGNRGASFKYPVMSIEELMDLRPFVRKSSKPDSTLFMWVTKPFLFDARDLMISWGFTPRKNPIAFDWVKLCKKTTSKYHRVPGHFTWGNSEYVLVGQRGKPKHIKGAAESLVVTSVQEHSRKPDEVNKRIERLYPNSQKLEMFARRQLEGWDVWGNEV